MSNYEIKKYLPKELSIKLPSEDDINLHIDIKENSDR